MLETAQRSHKVQFGCLATAEFHGSLQWVVTTSVAGLHSDMQRLLAVELWVRWLLLTTRMSKAAVSNRGLTHLGSAQTVVGLRPWSEALQQDSAPEVNVCESIQHDGYKLLELLCIIDQFGFLPGLEHWSAVGRGQKTRRVAETEVVAA